MPTYHDKIDKGDGVKGDTPQVHQAEHADDNHRYGNADNGRRPEVTTQQDEGHEEYSRSADAEYETSVVPDRKVLLVEHVEYAAKYTRKQSQLCCFVQCIIG